MPHASKPAASATPTETAGQPTVIAVDKALTGERLDRALARVVPGLSRTRAQAAIAAGRVTVDGKPAKASLPLVAGMRVELAPAPQAGGAAPRGKRDASTPPLRVVYEDAQMLVVDKPAGVVVHPAPGHAAGTLVDALLAHEPSIEGGDDPTRPGIVHRLDKDTSGLLVIAKTPAAHAALAEQMRERRMVKRYLALVEGQMSVPEGVIEAPIGRDPRRRQRMAVVAVPAGGREARTRFRVLRTAKGRSLLELQLETGRTHQIRVHLTAVHHPVVGDPVYGRPQPPQPPRQLLHAAHLELAHPVTGEWMVFDSPLPDDLAAFLANWEH
jgi:23S rRNA pseudouridine1911/1915/1917 synthase